MDVPTGIGPQPNVAARAATLGNAFQQLNNLNEVAACGHANAGVEWTQPRCGWTNVPWPSPRVARAARPWALRLNPFGIPASPQAFASLLQQFAVLTAVNTTARRNDAR